MKIQSDVARVGIKANLRPVDQVNLRTEYTTGKAKGGVLTFWNPPAVENRLWAAAVVQRVAKRVHWDPPEDVVKLVSQAATEADPRKQADLWVEWQKKVVDQANHFILFQPVYQIAVRNTDQGLPADRRRLDARSAWRDAVGRLSREVRRRRSSLTNIQREARGGARLRPVG